MKGSTKRILFVCHGNICRSPMAEFVMKHLVKQAGLEDQFLIASAATTTDELGNDIYPKAKAELKRRGIPFEHRKARQIRSNENWGLIVVMDQENLRDVQRIVGADQKVRLLMSFVGDSEVVGENRSVADPWYTRDFAKAFDDIRLGCERLLESLK